MYFQHDRTGPGEPIGLPACRGASSTRADHSVASETKPCSTNWTRADKAAGAKSLWPVFGATNQVLAALAEYNVSRPLGLPGVVRCSKVSGDINTKGGPPAFASLADSYSLHGTCVSGPKLAPGHVHRAGGWASP